MGIRCRWYGHFFRQIFKRLRFPSRSKLSQYKLLSVTVDSVCEYVCYLNASKTGYITVDCITFFIISFIGRFARSHHHHHLAVAQVIFIISQYAWRDNQCAAETVASLSLSVSGRDVREIRSSCPSYFLLSLSLVQTVITLNSLVTWIAHYTVAIFLSFIYFLWHFIRLFNH